MGLFKNFPETFLCFLFFCNPTFIRLRGGEVDDLKNMKNKKHPNISSVVGIGEQCWALWVKCYKQWSPETLCDCTTP